MDARLTTEQRELRDAAARLADDLGPGSVQDLADADRAARLEKAVAATGWRTLRSDGASGVEVAIVAEEFARGLVDVPFAGPVLADDLRPHAEVGDACTIAVDVAAGRAAGTVEAVDAAGAGRALVVRDGRVLAGLVGAVLPETDLTRRAAEVGALEPAGALDPDAAGRRLALALAVTSADLVGAARGALALAVGYAGVREQYGKAIGSYQAVAHPLAEGRALIEGSVSVLRHAAWAVDELTADEALRAARIAKVYCARAARAVCETAVQVHGGIGNTWECLAHVYLRRALASAELFPARLEEIDLGLS
ncbi:acyl-CoA dehydrogenase family protein [Actinomadura sp. WAC 06369]|uniref:acyl-CoA dehydrogenase family protein n=1 Tax=Actinomadura sp. WAC 06369 TaxID=2203193 RepID=UPI000F777D5A|nr:acyl-CoA dehydrogenase family protein [Actinomadura sp. WAC 06369]RSN50701.1 acyl-CoA dehydrogenase [Actinomadura sp. WAC 06369]